MRIFAELRQLSLGHSYWQATLASGRTLSEMDSVTDLRLATRRRVEWLEDLIGSGDLAHVREVRLCTPQGQSAFPVTRPCTAFQLNCGISSFFDGSRVQTAQIVGVIANAEGDCTVAIWDALEQRFYPEFHSNVLRFAAWREGTFPLGRLNLEALGVRL